ncbi:mitochondrial ribosomal subunit protein-domain-containing protein [Crassisporium funariophilum]|nr:mitochondrial ribosomal subunit protein-domain-containing protein [Crassisporium funariophilum]
MAHSSLAQCLGISRALRRPSGLSSQSLRRFTTSKRVCQRRKKDEVVEQDEQETGRRTRSVLEEDLDDVWEQLEESSEIQDSPSGGHMILQEQRQVLHYMRLIEHEMPKLVAYRKPFIPPTSSTPVILRSMHYQGEGHPAVAKRVIVVPVDQLPLNNETAIHKLKLLAGPRWTPNPPADAGVSRETEWGNGYVKISCEDFPRPSMNLKWASDTLDKLIAEANDSKDTFSDLPLDLRHVYAKALKAKKGDHLRNRALNRPSVKDFPKEWLPPVDSATPAPSEQAAS